MFSFGIVKKKGLGNMTTYIAEVKKDLGLPMHDAPNEVQKLKQTRKHSIAKKAEAIKDVLRYFGVI